MIVPNKTFKFRIGPDWDDRTTDDLFKGKRVVVVSLPGAFTPICSSKQLPKYEEMYDQFKEAGIDAVYCVSVNDAFVMNAWAKDLGVEKVEMVPDGDGAISHPGASGKSTSAISRSSKSSPSFRNAVWAKASLN